MKNGKQHTIHRVISAIVSMALVLSMCCGFAVSAEGGGSGKKVLLDVEYTSQEGYVRGSESASAVMLLHAWGIPMDLDTFVDDYLDKGDIYLDSNGYHAPNPNEAFVGDPRSADAYGCYAPVIVNSLERCKHAAMTVHNETGATLPELCAKYIDNGMPVIVWATRNMHLPRKGYTWHAPSGEEFTWIGYEHGLLLVGYDDENYYFNDPYQNKGCVAYPRDLVEERYADLMTQAVGIQVNTVMGDMDFDGRISTADAVLALQYAADLLPKRPLPLSYGDMNDDGIVNTADAVLMLQKAAGLI